MKCIVLNLTGYDIVKSNYVFLIFSGLPGRPSAVANTIGPGTVQVVLNPFSSGGLPTSYSRVTISNSSYMYVCSDSTPAFLNGSAMVTCNDLSNSTNYTISAMATNCAGSSNSSNPITIYVSCMCKVYCYLIPCACAHAFYYASVSTLCMQSVFLHSKHLHVLYHAVMCVTAHL